MAQSPYGSVQKSKLFAMVMVLIDFPEPLSKVTESQYAESVLLHIETIEFILDDIELTLLFIQLQVIIRNRNHFSWGNSGLHEDMQIVVLDKTDMCPMKSDF